MLAWLSSSLITASSSASSVSNNPPLASKQLEYRMLSSVSRNAASAASSSLCTLCVPQMKRTDAMPKPYRARPSRAAATSRGSSASPR